MGIKIEGNWTEIAGIVEIKGEIGKQLEDNKILIYFWSL